MAANGFDYAVTIAVSGVDLLLKLCLGAFGLGNLDCTGDACIFGLSAFRFSNLPFQSWELRPDGPNRAVIALSAAAVQAEFALEPGLVTLVKFSSGNKPPVRGIIDVPMKLKDLINSMSKTIVLELRGNNHPCAYLKAHKPQHQSKEDPVVEK